ncbi:hypothetical protein TTHERM_000532839 (macronuclear) [Tetrahymena thermophila SB210]|uniref:Uncharacterized protein n=1 Tax=Tetrahymena thermophila (strain SB210) TaxID=312017 RepID=W7X395_TETTS|nr:hypothetical protein TTHERM_000532839 [Tetrahymena thermophila SB210]EWS71922.1 hypothetical protein TTHERM_000532839 [Tetrahymena thermophila SB210]|eukprot:XP_012655551.1 hypothetical protein TTHERM_000532839 [Tetrahymena thermophila SB210]
MKKKTYSITKPFFHLQKIHKFRKHKHKKNYKKVFKNVTNKQEKLSVKIKLSILVAKVIIYKQKAHWLELSLKISLVKIQHYPRRQKYCQIKRLSNKSQSYTKIKNSKRNLQQMKITNFRYLRLKDTIINLN